MRTLLICCFFVFALRFAAAQSAPAPTPPEIILEDELKLGIYDNVLLQPAARNFRVRQATGRAKDGELLLDPCTDPQPDRRDRFNSEYVRKFLRLHGITEAEAVAILLSAVSERELSQTGID